MTDTPNDGRTVTTLPAPKRPYSPPLVLRGRRVELVTFFTEPSPPGGMLTRPPSIPTR